MSQGTVRKKSLCYPFCVIICDSFRKFMTTRNKIVILHSKQLIPFIIFLSFLLQFTTTFNENTFRGLLTHISPTPDFATTGTQSIKSVTYLSDLSLDTMMLEYAR